VQKIDGSCSLDDQGSDKFHSSPHKDCLIGAWAIKDPDKVKFMALAPLKAKRRQLFAPCA